MESQRVAVVQLCVDDRLDHARIRAQVAERLSSLHLRVDRILLVNEVGGNFGSNFRNAVDLFQERGAQIVFCALLHHDDCAAAEAGRRHPMEQSVAELSACLAERRAAAPVYAGSIRTSTNEVTW